MQKLLAWDESKVTSKAEVVRRTKLESKKVHFVTLMDLCHLTHSVLKTKFQKHKGRVELRGDIVKGDSEKLRCIYGEMCFSVPYDGGRSPVRYFKIAGCSGQASYAVSAYAQVEM